MTKKNAFNNILRSLSLKKQINKFKIFNILNLFSSLFYFVKSIRFLDSANLVSLLFEILVRKLQKSI